MALFTKKEVFPIVLILFIVVLSIYIYPSLPKEVPSHWNAQGQIDDWSSREFTVWFFPSLILAVYLLMMFIPLMDPLRKNYASFTVPYYWFRTAFVVFFSALYLFTIWTALGGNLNINYFILPAIAVLFIVIGIFLPQIKRNYFVGLRTPWTLASEETWDKTHAFGGKLFIIVGILSFFSFLFYDKTILTFVLAVLVAVIISFIYSYLVFKKVGGFKNNN